MQQRQKYGQTTEPEAQQKNCRPTTMTHSHQMRQMTKRQEQRKYDMHQHRPRRMHKKSATLKPEHRQKERTHPRRHNTQPTPSDQKQQATEPHAQPKAQTPMAGNENLQQRHYPRQTPNNTARAERADQPEGNATLTHHPGAESPHAANTGEPAEPERTHERQPNPATAEANA